MNVVAEIKPYLMLGSVAVRTPGFIRNNEITLVINGEFGENKLSS